MRVQLLVQHQVVAKKRVRVVSMLKPLLAGEDRGDDGFFYLRDDRLVPVVHREFTVLVVLIHQECLHLVRLPHVVLDFVLAKLLHLTVGILAGDAGIGKVHELVAGVGWVVVLAGEAQIGGHPDPDGERVDTGYEDPLADVELLAEDDKGALNVLLHDPDCFA